MEWKNFSLKNKTRRLSAVILPEIDDKLLYFIIVIEKNITQ